MYIKISWGWDNHQLKNGVNKMEDKGNGISKKVRS